MAALVLRSLYKSSRVPYEGVYKTELEADESIAFKMPKEVKTEFGGTITTEEENSTFTIQYSRSSDADFAAGTHEVVDIYQEEFDADTDFKVPLSARACIIACTAGSIKVEVSAR